MFVLASTAGVISSPKAGGGTYGGIGGGSWDVVARTLVGMNTSATFRGDPGPPVLISNFFLRRP